MRSIKIKFTLVLTATMFVVLLIFSSLIYFTNVVNQRGPLSTTDIQSLTRGNPRLRNYIEQSNDIEDIRELGETLREEQRRRYTRTVFLLILPMIGFSSIFAYFVASYLVKPIEDISVNMATIGSQNLSQRLNLNLNSEELDNLVITFNELLDELENSFNSQDRFIQDAAHELRTPLAAMKTNLQIFKENENKKVEDYKSLVSIFEKLSNKLIKINENLLFINRQRKREFSLEKVNIISLIEDIIEIFQPQITKKNVHLELNLSKDIDPINLDRTKITFAIKNLIENAIKYSRKDGKIMITLKEKDGFVILSVQDNGIGISNSEIDKIFERFYRGTNAIDSLEDGEGLGLSIVQEIVQMHGGKIEVESKEGVGTTFEIYFPQE